MRPIWSPVHWVPGRFPRKFSGRGSRGNIHCTQIRVKN